MVLEWWLRDYAITRYALRVTGHVHVVCCICCIVRTRNIDRHRDINQLLLALMSTVQTPRRIPNLQFRVLVLGRANAGKTTILQRVCDTTESPTIYRLGEYGQKEEVVRGPHFVCESDLTADQFKLEPSIGVSNNHHSPTLPIDIVPARRAHYRR